ncbi:MAG: hypothetical protein ACOC0A_05675, partial [Planctomycetota bacterium]
MSDQKGKDGQHKRSAEWLLTDFQTVLPSDRVDRDGRPGSWQLAPYHTEGFSGVMIQANPDARAPQIEIDVPIKGRYDLFFGMYRNFGDRILVRLEGDRCFERLAYSYPYGDCPCFQDVHWRTLDFSGGEKLQLRQDGEHRAAIGYIMARPAKEKASPAREYLLHITDDGFPSNWGVPLDREDASWIVEPLSRLNPRYIS